MKLKGLVRELFFKDEYNRMNIELVHLKGQLQMFRKTQNDTEQMITQILKNHHNQIVHYASNKCGEKVFVVKRSYQYDSEAFDLYLYCIDYSAYPNILPVVHCSYYNHYSLGANTPCIKIDDILMRGHVNKGNGTIAINGLITVAKHMNAKRIYGFLSPVDKERFDMLEHFYSKCGFIVTFNETKTAGHIELLL